MVHHADVAQGLLRLLRAPRGSASGRRYNIVDDAPATAVELHQINGEPLPQGMSELADDDPWSAITSNARLREELGWRPLYPSMWTARDAGALQQGAVAGAVGRCVAERHGDSAAPHTSRGPRPKQPVAEIS
jgi:UDP-glucose 4-epimerase